MKRISHFQIENCAVRYAQADRPMSALGQKQTLGHLKPMSALPPKADIGTQSRDVRFVPKADIGAAVELALFDHLVGG